MFLQEVVYVVSFSFFLIISRSSRVNSNIITSYHKLQHIYHLTSIHRASSTWKHDTRKFGPQNALDSTSDAAWKSAPSEESDPLAYYEIYFNRPIIAHEMRIQFQGGFVGMDCTVYKKTQQSIERKGSARVQVRQNNDADEEEWEELEELFVDPIDTTDIQTFPADIELNDAKNQQDKYSCTALRIEFGRSTDFYGRIVIYSLEVWGVEAEK